MNQDTSESRRKISLNQPQTGHKGFRKVKVWPRAPGRSHTPHGLRAARVRVAHTIPREPIPESQGCLLAHLGWRTPSSPAELPQTTRLSPMLSPNFPSWPSLRVRPASWHHVCQPLPPQLPSYFLSIKDLHTPSYRHMILG